MISMTASCRVVSRWKVSLYRAPFPTRSPVVSFTATQRGSHSGMRIGSEISPKTFSMAAGMLAAFVKETGPLGAGTNAGRALPGATPSAGEGALRRLFRGRVSSVARAVFFFLAEGRLVNQQIRSLRGVDGCSAGPGVAREGDEAPGTRGTHEVGRTDSRAVGQCDVLTFCQLPP